jgi:2-methylcitrate dehydratase PrpD
VIIETNDRERVEKRLDDPPGSYENPLSDDELRQKFQMCAVRTLEPSQVTDAWKSLDDL